MPLRMAVLVCDAAQGSQHMAANIPQGAGDALQLAIKSYKFSTAVSLVICPV